tara:strand:- start:428 stop:1807 length:1380 start_codon:yes stop_codon:yes gene_type:complete
MADNISYIHSNKIAKTNQQYYGKDGTIYVGQKDGRLKKLSSLNSNASSSAIWGGITGEILNQTDLISYIDNLPVYDTLDSLTDVTITTPALNDVLTFNGTDWINSPSIPALGYYGAFSDTTDQFAIAINTGYPMLLGITDLTNGITITSGSRITIANTGIYDIQWSAQFVNTDSTEHDVTVWLRRNLANLPGTSGVVSVPKRRGAINGHALPSWNFLLDAAAGDIYEFVWSTTDLAVYVAYLSGSGFAPTTASVVVTVTQQSGIMAGTGITAINLLTGAAQTLVTGTSGTDFAINSAGTAHTFNLPTASAVNRGALSSADWTTFNNKGIGNVTSVAALTLGTSGTNLSSSVATGTTTPVITLNVPTASAANRGALSSIDWTTFNNKQNALGYTPVANTRNINTTAPLQGGGDLSADRTLSITQASASTNGYITAADYVAFSSGGGGVTKGFVIAMATAL